MNLSRQNNIARWRLLAATVFVVVVFLFDAVTGGAIRGLVRSIGAGLWRGAGSVIHTIDRNGFLASRAALASENQYLRAELAQVQDKAALVGVLQQENNQLQAMLNMTGEHPKGVVAIIDSPASLSPNHTHIINAGSAEGIKEGDIALTDAGFVVGRIIEVQQHISLLQETFASGGDIPAIINKNTLTLVGKSGVGYGRLAHDMDASENDPVFSSTYGTHPIGIVGSVESSSTNAYRDVYVDLPVNPEVLQYVYVIPVEGQ